ncbi:MAG TPA: NYN domain-containing protein [Candidatus Peribacterales bacterium]|nr:NYN domain-containing protein [Candidatus Peribacterales bacterium]
MQKRPTNYAFIDSNNVHLGIQRLGWTLDYRKFRRYLKEKYAVEKAYLFIGFLPQNADLYRSLQEKGYILIFKQILDQEGHIKGNIDAELVLHTMIQYEMYGKAVVVTSDGDFACLVEYLHQKNKLETVLSPSSHTMCSVLLRRAAKEKMMFMDTLRQKLAYEKAPLGDGTPRSTSS